MPIFTVRIGIGMGSGFTLASQNSYCLPAYMNRPTRSHHAVLISKQKRRKEKERTCQSGAFITHWG
jgi:hypothetical protein